MIDRDQIEIAATAASATPSSPLAASVTSIAAPRQPALGQPPQPVVVVDVEDAGAAWLAHWASGSGTWITDRNSPSWRIACAKLS